MEHISKLVSGYMEREREKEREREIGHFCLGSRCVKNKQKGERKCLKGKNTKRHTQ